MYGRGLIQTTLDNQQPLDEAVRELNKYLTITSADPKSQEASARKKELVEASKKVRGSVYLDDEPSSWVNFVSMTKYLAGYSSLRNFPAMEEPRAFGISYLTHPMFEGVNCATAAALYTAITAVATGKVDRIFANVRRDTTSEGIIQRLGFERTRGFAGVRTYEIRFSETDMAVCSLIVQKSQRADQYPPRSQENNVHQR